MLERMKGLRTSDTTRFCIVGPVERKAEALAELERLGFVPSDESAEELIPWREGFPELKHNEAGVMIRGARGREGFTQRELARRTGIPQRHISEMENGKRPVGKEIARKLAAALNVDYRVFL